MTAFHMQPALPLFPPIGECNLPQCLGLLPLISTEDSWWKRVKALINERPKFILNDDYFTWCEPVKAWVWIPKNFVYDFASIPKQVPISPAGVLAYGAGPHDFAYRFGGLLLCKGIGEPYYFVPIGRKNADTIFHGMIKQANDLVVLDHIAVNTLRLVGFKNYKARDIIPVDWNHPVFSYPSPNELI